METRVVNGGRMDRRKMKKKEGILVIEGGLRGSYTPSE